MIADATAHMVRLAELYAGATELSEATVSDYATGQATTIARLRCGHTITVRRAARIVQWFSDHWPVDLEWPADLSRPDPSPDFPTAQGATPSVSQALEYRSGIAPADLVAAVRAARERSVDAMGDAHRDPDFAAQNRAQAEMMAAAYTLGPDGRIASPEALCLALDVERHVYDNVARSYADGGPREHKRPKKRRGLFPSDTERMFTALVASGDVRFASRRAGMALLARAGIGS